MKAKMCEHKNVGYYDVDYTVKPFVHKECGSPIACTYCYKRPARQTYVGHQLCDSPKCTSAIDMALEMERNSD